MPFMASAQKDLLIDTTMVPVELIYFRGELMYGMVAFDWATASELNNDHFLVERSNDGENFFVTDVIPGQGTSNTRHLYIRWYDYAKYFRLSQVDINGKTEFLGMVMIPESESTKYLYYDINGREVQESYRGLRIKANR